MDLFKDGLGQTNTQLGDGWCGEALGKGDVAIAFEGGWLKGAMDAFPKIKWQFAEMPTGSIGKKVTINYTAAYGIGTDSKNKDQAWVLMQYLTGPEGMAKWTSGGIAVPSRSGRAGSGRLRGHRQGRGLRQARLGLHARLPGRPQGVRRRVPEAGHRQDLRRRPGGRRHEGGDHLGAGVAVAEPAPSIGTAGR
jgi:hypothetical protein